MRSFWQELIKEFGEDIGFVQVSIKRSYHLRHIGIEAVEILHKETRFEALFLVQLHKSVQ